jgi:hypothetical protein
MSMLFSHTKLVFGDHHYVNHKSWWRKYMPMQSEGQGKKCTDCARFQEERIKATSSEEKQQVTERLQAHIDEVLADRNVPWESLKLLMNILQCLGGASNHNWHHTLIMNGMEVGASDILAPNG